MMELRTDFSRRVVVHGAELPWSPSPEPGVERRMFDRSGGEIARATSMVRYAPGSQFAPHVHGAGEELLVLEGIFADEHGQYPAGTYVRNPWGTQHAPGSPEGCTLFVKLRQMASGDQRRVVTDTAGGPWVEAGSGLETRTLHEHGAERVWLERWAPGTSRADLERPGGVEIFVLAGACRDRDDVFRLHTCARLPPGTAHSLETRTGCLLWLKRPDSWPTATGPLP
jgi:anti-sigma factor ChrR (cupin superfamily)